MGWFFTTVDFGTLQDLVEIWSTSRARKKDTGYLGQSNLTNSFDQWPSKGNCETIQGTSYKPYHTLTQLDIVRTIKPLALICRYENFDLFEQGIYAITVAEYERLMPSDPGN